MPPTRIHYNHIKPLLLEFRDTLSGDGDGIGFGVGAKVGYFRFRCGLPGLVECAGAECVGADDGGFEAAALVVDCELWEGMCCQNWVV